VKLFYNLLKIFFVISFSTLSFADDSVKLDSLGISAAEVLKKSHATTITIKPPYSIPSTGGKIDSVKPIDDNDESPLQTNEKINGGWSNWGKCSAICGGEIQTRECTKPKPQNGGKICSGIKKKKCGLTPCK